MSGTEESGRSGGTPPPHFLQTNTEAPIRRRGGQPNTEAPIRRRGGQPGNSNALKHGRRTAQMTALRAEVRFAVGKAKALAAAAWSLDPPRPAGDNKPAR